MIKSQIEHVIKILRRGQGKLRSTYHQKKRQFLDVFLSWISKFIRPGKIFSDHRSSQTQDTVKLTVFYRTFRILTVLTFSEVKNNARIVFLVQKYVRIVFFEKVLAFKIFGQFLKNSNFRKKSENPDFTKTTFVFEIFCLTSYLTCFWTRNTILALFLTSEKVKTVKIRNYRFITVNFSE